MNLWIIFLTGLTVGGVSCAAVQAGLLASVVTARESGGGKSSAWPVITFLVAKLVVYTVFGFFLGFLGEKLSLSPTVQIGMQAVAGLYMVAVALNLLNVHPVFRYVLIQPPRFIARGLRNESRSRELFAPAFLGVMTVFIPCGTTLAMEALAISTASPLLGASVMALFTLGTIPLFLGIGFVAGALSVFSKSFVKIAAVAVMFLGLNSLNGVLNLVGFPVTAQSVGRAIKAIAMTAWDPAGSSRVLASSTVVEMVSGVQVAHINVAPTAYDPDYIKVKVGVPVRLNLSSVGGVGCTSVFRMPSLNITERIGLDGKATVEFTPKIVGKIPFTCSMGMYGGVVEAV